MAELEVRWAPYSDPSDPEYFWESLTDKVRESPGISIRRGRNDELAEFQVGEATMVLDNRDRVFDELNDQGPYRQTAIQFSKDGDGYVKIAGADSMPGGLVTTGALTGGASTPDAAALDITGDLDVWVRLQPERWNLGGSVEHFLSKSGASVPSWQFFRHSDDSLRFEWWDAGGTLHTITSQDGVDPFGLIDDLNPIVYWFRATLDVDNGNGGHTVTMWYSSSAEPQLDPAEPIEFRGVSQQPVWVKLASVTVDGVTTVRSGDQKVWVGNNDANNNPLTGYINAARVYDGLAHEGGTLVAGVDFTDSGQWTVGDTNAGTGTGFAGETWTIGDGDVLDSIAPFMRLEAAVIVQPDCWCGTTGKERLLWSIYEDDVSPVSVVDLILLDDGSVRLDWQTPSASQTATSIATVQQVAGVGDGEPAMIRVRMSYDERPGFGDATWDLIIEAEAGTSIFDYDIDTRVPYNFEGHGFQSSMYELGTDRERPLGVLFGTGDRIITTTAASALGFRRYTPCDLYIGGRPDIHGTGNWEQFAGSITAFRLHNSHIGWRHLDWWARGGLPSTTYATPCRGPESTNPDERRSDDHPYSVVHQEATTSTLYGNVVWTDVGTAIVPQRPLNIRIKRSWDAWLDLPGGTGDNVDVDDGLPGTLLLDGTGDYASVDRTVLSEFTVDNLELVVCAKADDWTPATESTLISQYSTVSNQRGFRLSVLTGGGLNLYWSTTGSDFPSAGSSVALPFANGEWGWVKAELIYDNGANAEVRFFTSTDSPATPPDEVVWTKLGTTQTGTSIASIHQSTFDVWIGAFQTTGPTGTQYLDGEVRYAHVANGIGATPLLTVDFANPNDFAPGTAPGTSRQGDAVTFTGDAQVIPAAFVTGTALEVRAHLRADDYTPASGASQIIVTNYGAGATTGWQIGIGSTARLFFGYGDGATTQFISSAANSLYEFLADGDDVWLSVTYRDDTLAMRYSFDGVAWTEFYSAALTAPLLAHSDNRFFLGSNDAGSQALEGRMHRFQIWDAPEDIGGRLVCDIDFTGRETTDTTWTTPDRHSLTIGGSAAIAESVAEWRDLFTGYITGWPQETDDTDGAPVVPITALDGFDIASRATLPTSEFERLMERISFDSWWKLGDAPGSTVAVDYGYGKRDATPVNVSFGGGSVVPAVPNSGSAQFGGSNSYLVVPDSDILTYDIDGPWSVVAAFRTSDPPASGGLAVLYIQALDGNNHITTYMDDAGRLCVIHVEAGGGFAVRTTGSFADGQPHVVMFSRDKSFGTQIITENGYVPVASFTAPALPKVPSAPTIGAIPSASTIHAFKGDIAHVALLKESSGFWGTELADAFRDVHSGVLMRRRIWMVLDRLGVPTALRDIDQGKTRAGPFVNLDTFGLDHLRKIAATEGGRLFIDPSGRWRFMDRYVPLTSYRSRYTQQVIGDNQANGLAQVAVPISATGLQSGSRADLIYNTAEIASSGGGAPLLVKDEASRKRYGVRVLPMLDSVGESDATSRAQAEYAIDRYSRPLFRIPQVTLLPLRPTGDAHFTTRQQWNAATAQITDRLDLIRQPNRTGDVEVLPQLVEGVEHVFTGKQWETTLNLSPADIRPYWQWGQGAWSSTARWAY